MEGPFAVNQKMKGKGEILQAPAEEEKRQEENYTWNKGNWDPTYYLQIA